MKIKTIQNYKSIPSGLDFEFPMLTILVGENGSGKTQLFEMLMSQSRSQILIDNKLVNKIKFVPFGGLIPKLDNKIDYQGVKRKVDEVLNQLQSAQKIVIKNGIKKNDFKTADQDPTLLKFTSKSQRDIILGISNITNVMPINLTEDHIYENVKALNLSKDNLFESNFALLYKSYQINYVENKLRKLYHSDGIECSLPYLDERDFEIKYGPPPWLLVDSILEKIKLPFKTNSPMGLQRDTVFQFKLIHKESLLELDVAELSTGERTLMSLVLALYNSSEVGYPSTELLMLDEPDASLHPNMIKLLLEIIEDEIVNKAKIPVILSTHSPVTIACAPAGSLYKITKDNKLPVKCNLDDSVKILSSNIPSFQVSLESRRQVFVEHSYDVNYYESLFTVLSRIESFQTYPQFLPPHNLNGSNCDAVLDITRKLRNMGNKFVFGLVDWDLKNKPEGQIIILGLGRRYAIENYIFDPHILGLYLIHKRIENPNIFGLNDCYSYLDVVNKIKIEPEILQLIVDSVENKIQLDSDSSEKVDNLLIGGSTVKTRKEFFLIKGHDLEEKVKNTWPSLRAIRNNNEGDLYLKRDVISTVLNDNPQLISVDIMQTFKEIT